MIESEQWSEKVLNITNYRAMPIKTTVGLHLTPVRTAVTKKPANEPAKRGCEEKETPYTVGGNIKW